MVIGLADLSMFAYTIFSGFIEVVVLCFLSLLQVSTAGP